MPPPLSSRPPLPGSSMTLPPLPGPPPAAAGGGVSRPAEDDGAAAAAKRQRVDFVLTAEDDFLAQIGDGPSKVGCRVWAWAVPFKGVGGGQDLGFALDKGLEGGGVGGGLGGTCIYQVSWFCDAELSTGLEGPGIE